MIDPAEMKLFERFSKWLDEADAIANETIGLGHVSDWGQFREKVGYRKALADCRTVIKEELEILLKE